MPHALPTRLTAISAALLLASLAANGQAPRSPTPKPVDAPIRAVSVAQGLEHPWGLAFLPDGRMLVSERPNGLRIVSPDGRVSELLSGVPKAQIGGQGGYLDVALSPTFEQDSLVYLAFSEPGQGGASTAVARGRLGPNGLEETKVIWRQLPKVQSANHWGSRLLFTPDGKLFVTLGDRFVHRQRAQDLSTTIGKIVRLDPDGTAPQDNPFAGRSGVRPEIWSYGHRNIQAAAIHPQTGQLWTVEHGARGGDELNRPQAGRNYGWPVITYGRDYSGARIGQGTAKEGMEQPVYYWDPVIAPSGATFYTGDVFGEWTGDLFVGSLSPGVLVRLRIENERVTSEARYLGNLRARIRDVVQGPDGLLYLLTDSPRGQILRVEPAV